MSKNFKLDGYYSIHRTKQTMHTTLLPQIPYGIGIAAGIRVGNMLGAGEPGKAKKVSIIAAIFGSEYSS